MSNATWQFLHFAGLPGQKSVTSFQGQLDLGYRSGKWQFITGLGYLRTGVDLSRGSMVDLRHDMGVMTLSGDQYYMPIMYNAPGCTVYNPHIIMPVKVGYELVRFSNRLTLNPVIGAEVCYNIRRVFVESDLENGRQVETPSSFRENCNRISVAGLAQINAEYKMSKRFDLTAGPSVHYMLTSTLNFRGEYDYAVLFNAGLKWNFKKRAEM